MSAVNQTADASDALTDALCDPLSILLLRILQNRAATATELADALAEPLTGVKRQMRVLHRSRLVDELPARPGNGSEEHRYRARSPFEISRNAFGLAPDAGRQAIVRAVLDEALSTISVATSLSDFASEHARSTRRTLTLDDLGCRDVVLAIERFLKSARELEARTARLTGEDAPYDHELEVEVVALVFRAGARRRRTPHETARAGPGRCRSGGLTRSKVA
jgi:hypothetical protein